MKENQKYKKYDTKYIKLNQTEQNIPKQVKVHLKKNRPEDILSTPAHLPQKPLLRVANLNTNF